MSNETIKVNRAKPKALPTITAPEYKTTLPFCEKTIKFRPFLVKEEKLFLIATEENDKAQILNTITKVLDDCTFNKLDIENMASVDIEWLLLQLRAKSKGDEIEVSLTCQDEDCKTKMEQIIRVSDIKTTPFDKSKFLVPITEDIAVKIKAPTMKTVERATDSEDTLKMLISSVESIVRGDDVWLASDYEYSELESFFDTLNDEQLQKIVEPLKQLPKVVLDVKYTCPACKKENVLRLEGLENFFTIL